MKSPRWFILSCLLLCESVSFASIQFQDLSIRPQSRRSSDIESALHEAQVAFESYRVSQDRRYLAESRQRLLSELQAEDVFTVLIEFPEGSGQFQNAHRVLIQVMAAQEREVGEDAYRDEAALLWLSRRSDVSNHTLRQVIQNEGLERALADSLPYLSSEYGDQILQMIADGYMEVGEVTMAAELYELALDIALPVTFSSPSRDRLIALWDHTARIFTMMGWHQRLRSLVVRLRALPEATPETLRELPVETWEAMSDISAPEQRVESEDERFRFTSGRVCRVDDSPWCFEREGVFYPRVIQMGNDLYVLFESARHDNEIRLFVLNAMTGSPAREEGTFLGMGSRQFFSEPLLSVFKGEGNIIIASVYGVLVVGPKGKYVDLKQDRISALRSLGRNDLADALERIDDLYAYYLNAPGERKDVWDVVVEQSAERSDVLALMILVGHRLSRTVGRSAQYMRGLSSHWIAQMQANTLLVAQSEISLREERSVPIRDIGVEVSWVVTALIKLLRYNDTRVIDRSLLSLGEILGAMLDCFLDYSQHEESFVRAAAVAGLAPIFFGSIVADAYATSLVSCPDQEIQPHAIQLRVVVVPRFSECWESINNALSDSDEHVRAAARAVLGRG